MKKILLSAIITFIVIIANAQLPTFEWAKSMDATYNATSISITVDAYGNVYTAGVFSDTVDFDPGVGIYNLISNGERDIYISKSDASGNFIWAKSIGDTQYDIANSIVLDGAGNAYITGYFQGTVDFDPSHTIFHLFPGSGAYNMFVLKLDSSGNFIWAKSICGTGDIIGQCIALDAIGNIYSTGYFNGTADFNPGSGVANLTAAGSKNIFISKLDGDGNFVWAKGMGNDLENVGNSIATDAESNVYTTGYFRGTVDFDPGSATTDLISNDYQDSFISKFDSYGNFIWAKNIGGASDTNSVIGNSIAIGVNGCIYTNGLFSGTVDFDPGIETYNLSSMHDGLSHYDLFVLKLDSTGQFLWVKNIGGHTLAGETSISVDAADNVYTGGTFAGTIDFDPGVGTFNLSYSTIGAYFAAFLVKLDPLGNFIWATDIEGEGWGSSWGQSIAIDAFNNVYTTGSYRNIEDFDPGESEFNLTSPGSAYSIFIQKLKQGPLGIIESDITNNISIYPNPSTNELTLNFDARKTTSSIEIKNVLGQTVYSEELKNETAKQSKMIDISAFANGIYFIRLNNESKSYSKKFIKE